MKEYRRIWVNLYASAYKRHDVSSRPRLDLFQDE